MLYGHAIIIVRLLADRIERDECRRDQPKFGRDYLLRKAMSLLCYVLPEMVRIRGIVLVAHIPHGSVLEGAGYFRAEGRVDHHAGHRLLNEQVEEGIISRGDT